MSTTIFVPCHTTTIKNKFDQVVTANECAWRSDIPMTKEEKNHDMSEWKPVYPYRHKPCLPDETENDIMLSTHR